jgi:predicted RNase H-like HicB family nuclease
MELFNHVTLSLKDYNDLCNENTELARENKELNDAIEKLQDNDGQKVIIRECEQWDDEDGDECETKTTHIKGFDEVKQEVEEFYKGKFKDLENENEEIKKKFEDIHRKYLDAQCTISALKNRNLWQRIINK